jgi:hypothetical protein
MSDPRENRGTGRDMQKHNSALYWRILAARKQKESKDLKCKHKGNTLTPCPKNET